jgi:ubiquinone/menaquinone biosynthesis C-methylase UbiE
MRTNQPTDLVFDGDMHDSQFASLFQRDDIPFWVELAQAYGPRVLELACGTGRLTLPIALSGVAITGLDFSESMLRVADERARANNISITFTRGDIRQFQFETRFDFIFLPAGTFLHLLTRTDVEAFFTSVRRALTPTGVLALDVHNPTVTWLKTLPLPTAPQQRTFPHRTTRAPITVTTTTNYHADRQLLTQRHQYQFADGALQESTVVLKLCFPIELQWLLYYNGLTITQLYGGYLREPFTAQSARQIVLASPTSAP